MQFSSTSYFPSSLDIETQRLAFKTSYVLTGDRFQRVTVISPLSSEVNKGNVQMLRPPNPKLPAGSNWQRFPSTPSSD